MIADERLLALCECAEHGETNRGETNRMALKYIHVKNNMAEAVNGQILARTTFNTNDSEFPATSGEPMNGDDVLLSVDQVKTAFKCRPKTKYLPALQNVKIAIDRKNKKSLVIVSDGKNQTVMENGEVNAVFPDTKAIYPFYYDEKSTLVSISVENLEKLCKMAKKMNSACTPAVIFQIPHSDPIVMIACEEAIKYIIKGNGNIIKGVVMPMKIRSYEFPKEINQDF